MLKNLENEYDFDNKIDISAIMKDNDLKILKKESDNMLILLSSIPLINSNNIIKKYIIENISKYKNSLLDCISLTNSLLKISTNNLLFN